MGAWLAAVHGLAALVLPFAAMALSVKLLFACIVTLSLVRHWSRHATRTASSCVRSLRWDGDGSCRLERRDGTHVRLTLYPQAFVQPWLVILQLGAPGRVRRRLVILPDMLARDSFRQLRVRLRMAADETDAAR